MCIRDRYKADVIHFNTGDALFNGQTITDFGTGNMIIIIREQHTHATVTQQCKLGEKNEQLYVINKDKNKYNDEKKK